MTTTMKKFRLTAFIFCMLLFSATAHAGTFFVNGEAPSAGNGASWATAFTTVTQALNAAKDGDQIWVAEGTYYPTKTTDRNATFRLKPGVALLGGFSGTETELKKRNFKKHLTILSGDIGDIGVPDDNVFHVVTGSDNSALDGFTITGGYSLNTPWTSGKILTPLSLTAGPQAGFGAGMLNFQASPEIRNCIFQDNHALMGGAVYTMTARADTPAAKPTVSPKFTECTFWQNSALEHGGGVVNTLRTAPIFVSCVFDSNICDLSGGGMFNDFGAAPMLLNSIFRNNEAKFGGGMANEGASTPILYYSTFTGNRSLKTGPAIYQGAKSANTTILTKTVVWGNECECDDTRFFNGPPSVIRVQDSVIQNGYKGKSVFRANPGLDRKSETMLNVGYKTNGHRFRPSKLPHRFKDVAHFQITTNLPAYDDKYVSMVSPELLETMRTQPPTAPAKTVAPTSTPNVASAPQTTATLPATTLQTATTPAPIPTNSPAVPVAATPETISPVPAPQAEKTLPQPAQPKQQAMLTPPSSGLEKSAESKPDKSPSNVEALMLNLDRDGNGCVTINEVTDDMKPKFWRLDRNGDNCLSKIELAKTVDPKTCSQPQTIPSATAALAPQTPVRTRQPPKNSPGTATDSGTKSDSHSGTDHEADDHPRCLSHRIHSLFTRRLQKDPAGGYARKNSQDMVRIGPIDRRSVPA